MMFGNRLDVEDSILGASVPRMDAAHAVDDSTHGAARIECHEALTGLEIGCDPAILELMRDPHVPILLERDDLDPHERATGPPQ